MALSSTLLKASAKPFECSIYDGRVREALFQQNPLAAVVAQSSVFKQTSHAFTLHDNYERMRVQPTTLVHTLPKGAVSVYADMFVHSPEEVVTYFRRSEQLQKFESDIDGKSERVGFLYIVEMFYDDTNPYSRARFDAGTPVRGKLVYYGVSKDGFTQRYSSSPESSPTQFIANMKGTNRNKTPDELVVGACLHEFVVADAILPIDEVLAKNHFSDVSRKHEVVNFRNTGKTTGNKRKDSSIQPPLSAAKQKTSK